jgi:DNA-binding LytR/AlgR family response regulator
MEVLIVEDEIPARARLIEMLQFLKPELSIVGQAGSVKETVEWLQTHSSPDVAFVDIQLSDDHSFEIFRRMQINFPIVFVTAFDEYILQSFEYNAIDYLLKPISEERLKRSLEKVQSLKEHFQQRNWEEILRTEKPVNKKIIARKGSDFISLNIDEIAYFHTEHKLVFATERTGRKLIIDNTLSELEESLDGKRFFRLNRKFITSADAILKYKSDAGKLLVHLKPEVNEEVYVSKETAPKFRQWIKTL